MHACEKFTQMPISERQATVMRLKLCFNCLNLCHQVKSCKYPSCPKCNKRHNSKLHEESASSVTNEDYHNEQTNIQGGSAVLYTESVGIAKNQSSVMLATVLIYVNDSVDQRHLCRAVLDSGSQLNFITQSCAKKLNLSLSDLTFNIVGVSSMSSTAKRLNTTTILFRLGNYQYNVNFYSVPIIVNALPSQYVNRNSVIIPDHIKRHLADPQFHQPGPIDILIGADVFFDFWLSEKYSLPHSTILHQTKFGWVVEGKWPGMATISLQSNSCMLNEPACLFSTTKLAQRTQEEKAAEEHFSTTHSRNADGRFMLRLPFMQSPSLLGDSFSMAQRRYGHMEPAEPINDEPVYYLPHHAVFKHDSTTTKIRVVFDGSATTTSGLSLSDILLEGPKVQFDIFHILLRFRLHPIAITADVAKMYRQILLHIRDCNLQRILYRSQPVEPLHEFNLRSITYGTKSASFLATRCLTQISQELPCTITRRIITEDFYVDDLISGGSTEEECYTIYERLYLTLEKFGFPLHKWCCSSQAVIDRFSKAERDPNFMVELKDNEVISALGLLVASLKASTISRLEFCGALLLAELLVEVQKELTKLNFVIPQRDVYLWTDSTIAPPYQWPLVRVSTVHPGTDGIVRAVTVRNSGGTEFKRPVVKLAFLPTADYNEMDEHNPL
ncbi:uncharacterized protein LOC126902072 [Daktulosphaira vitifoliae]|uniref:uncharacterized protein LOC126902072 n=1 Tax=Daktulosphaira vitifoliae TaxID=58002 RepID=UPI0021AAC545|nr:uncharacterized protein LOC126902072 [Daktulosphaira vitifoliae]